LLASGEPISKIGFDLGFVLNSLSLAGAVKTARDRKPLGVRTVAMRVVIFCMYNFVYIFFSHYHEGCVLVRDLLNA
jgi:hypothetical protein